MNEGLLLAARVIGVAVGLPFVTWAFGSAILGRFTRLDREERFAAAFGLGIVVLAVCAFLAFVLHAPQPLFNLGVVGLMLGAALCCRLTTNRQPAEGAVLWPLAAVFVLGYLHLVCIQALLPAYRGSYWFFDWWMHYDEALVFVGDRPLDTTWAGYTVASRTPFFNLTTAFVMGIAGHGFDVYQVAAALLNWCFPLALYLLLRDFFGRRAAWLALLLAPLNLWMLHNAWFTWPKMLAAYYIVLALHFYLQSVRCRRAAPERASGYFCAFCASALFGYLTHQVALVYAVPLLLHAVHLAVRERGYRPRLRELLGCTLLAAAVVGPWYVWLAGTLGRDKITGSTPVTLGDNRAHFRPLEVATWMGFDLGASVIPLGLGETFFGGELPPGTDPPADCLLVTSYEGKRWCFRAQVNLVGLHRGLTQLYFSLFTGALTLSLSAFLLVSATRGLWRRFIQRTTASAALPATKEESKAPPLWSAVWLFVIVGTLSAAFLHPGKIPWGIAHSAAFPSTLVLVGLAWGLLTRARRTVGALVCGGMVLEFLLMFWLHWWLLFHNPEVLEPGAGATGPRTEGVHLLNEVLGRGDVIFLAGAVLVQLALIGLLLQYFRRPSPAPAGATR